MEVAASALALVGAAATVTKILNQLRIFISDVREVDETMESFCSEMKSLHNVLESIGSSFTKVEPLLSSDEHVRRIWSSVERTGEDCQHAIGQLHKIFRRYEKNTSNAYQAILKQIKLQSRTAEIAELRRRISSYNIALQTSLTSIILCIVSQAPGNQASQENIIEAVFSRLDERIAGLTRHLALLKTVGKRPEDLNEADDEIEDEDKIQLIEDLEECHQSAKAIYSSASTVVGVFSTTGSELGSPLTPMQKDRIVEWAEKSFFSDTISTEPSLDVLTRFSGSETDLTVTDMTSVYGVESTSPPQNWTPEDSRVRASMVVRAKALYYEGSYSQAIEVFRDASNIGVGGPFSGDNLSEWTTVDSLSLWINLADVRRRGQSGQLGNVDQASYIPPWPRLEPDYILGPKVRVQDCRDAFVLAHMRLHLGSITEAQTLCTALLDGYSRLLGPKSLEYDEAVLLMVEILYSSGHSELARAWRTRVSSRVLGMKASKIQPVPPDAHPLTGLLKYAQRAASIGNFYDMLFLLGHCNPSNESFVLGYQGAQQMVTSGYATQLTLKGQHTVPSGPTARIKDDSCLSTAAKSDSLANISLLLEYCYPNTQGRGHLLLPAIGTVITHNNVGALDILLRSGGDVNMVFNQRPPQGFQINPVVAHENKFYPLGLAVSLGHAKAVDFLIKHGASADKAPNVATNSTTPRALEPPLYVAVRSPKAFALVPQLLEAGANPNREWKYLRILTIAIKMFCELNENPNRLRSTAPDIDKAIEEARAMIELLIAFGAEVRPSDKVELIKRAKKCGLELGDVLDPPKKPKEPKSSSSSSISKKLSFWSKGKAT